MDTRYKVLKEVTKNGRKVEVQWAVEDTLEGRVIARYAKEKDAQGLVLAYQKAVASKSAD